MAELSLFLIIYIARTNYVLVGPCQVKRFLPTCLKYAVSDYPKPSSQQPYITKTRLFKYIENFTTKTSKFSDKNSDIFHILAQKHRLWVLVRTASSKRF